MLKNKLSLMLVIFQLVFVALLASPVLAENGNSGRGADTRSGEAARKGQPSKTKACQARESAVITRMKQLTKLVMTMESTFDKIADRVKTYHNTKIIPSGKVVPNYDTLVTDIANKKALVTTALATAQADTDSFNCATSDPKTSMAQFRTDMQAVKIALNDYRTSVKNLIVAIKPVSLESEKSGKKIEPTVTK